MHQLDQEGKLLRVHMRLFICNPSIHPSAHLKAVSGHRHHDVKQDDVGQQRGQGQELHGVLRIRDLLNLQSRHLGVMTECVGAAARATGPMADNARDTRLSSKS